MNAAESPARLLILGGGAIVSECHLPALRALGWLESCTVVEPFPRNADLIRAGFPGAEVRQTGFEEVLGDRDALKKFDGALVALPNTLHAKATILSVKSGLPVLCEKPLAMTAAECRQIGEAARENSRDVFVGMVRRFMPGVLALRKALAEQLIGDVLRVSLEQGGDCRHWPWDTETVLRRDQGGCLVNMGVHFLDLLEWTLGSLTPESYSDDSAGGIEVNCDLKLRTTAGVPVELRISWTHALKNALRIEGTKGVLRMSVETFETAEWFSSDDGVSATLRVPRPFESGDWRPTFESCFVEQLWQFVETVRGRKTGTSLVSAEQAARSQDLIEWAYSHRDPKPATPAVISARPTLEPANVVVTGGTGFVGGHLVGRLAELGMTSIKVPVRRFNSGATVSRYPATMVRADLLSLESCRGVVRGARHVFHLAYGTSGTGADRLTLEGTRNILQACADEGVESVVVFGTCTVWAGNSGTVTETTPMQPTMADYGASKARMQEECLQFATSRSKPRVTIIAPGAVYGPQGGLFCATPCEMALAGSFAWFEGGSGICNYVYVSNLVDAAILAARQPDAHGQVFIVVDGQTTWRQFLTPFVKPWLDQIPDLPTTFEASSAARSGSLKDVFRAALLSPQFMAAVSNHPVLGTAKDLFTRQFQKAHQDIQSLRPKPDLISPPEKKRPQPAGWLKDIFGPSRTVFSAEKARRVLHWTPLISLEEGQLQSLNWLKERGLIP